MVYVGQQLGSPTGTVEPALINPKLPVAPHQPERPSPAPGPTPAYHLMSASHRATYLSWLAGGRLDPEVPPGLVALFLSGLERRVLLDAAGDPAVRREFPALAAEVRRLRATYGPGHRALDSATGAFLDALDLLTAPTGAPAGPPPTAWSPHHEDADRWPVPVGLRVALARFAVSRVPVPPTWARLWAWYHPTLYPRTPQTRCPHEFDTLFGIRYPLRTGGGLLPRFTDRPATRFGYRPVNQGMDTVVIERPDLPDVLEEPASTRVLGAVIDEVCDALTPYSRWLARTPGGQGSLASTMLLPDDLLEAAPGPMLPLSTWANDRLSGCRWALVDGSDFAPFWSTSDASRMSRDEASSLAVVLARIGLGVEPDVRFGGPPLATGPALLFRLGDQSGTGPAPGYPVATTVLAVLVTSGLLHATGDAVNRTITALSAEVRLSVGERSRLSAHLRWLIAANPRQATVRRRVAQLTDTEREAAAYVVVSVAADRSPLRPDVVEAAATAYRLLGLDLDLLYHRLHHHPDRHRRGLVDGGPPNAPARGPRPHSSSDPEATAVHPQVPPAEHPLRVSSAPTAPGTDADDLPVLVRRGHPGPRGYPLPRVRPVTSPTPLAPTPGGATGTTAAPTTTPPGLPASSLPAGTTEPGATPHIVLDHGVVAERLVETQAVSALLTGIFTEEDPAPAPTSPGGTSSGRRGDGRPAGDRPCAGDPSDPPRAELSPGEPPCPSDIPGLDTAHSRILRELAARTRWHRRDIEVVAATHGVLPSGALDMINEVATEIAGAPVVEEDGDELTIDHDVLQEILT